MSRIDDAWRRCTDLYALIEHVDERVEHGEDALEPLLDALETLEEILKLLQSSSPLDVQDTLAELEQLVPTLAAHELAVVERAQTAQRQLRRDPRWQRQAQAQRERLVQGRLERALREISPNCPSCKRPMLLRQNRTQGTEFWGCAQYPRCEHTWPLTARQHAILDAAREG